jgi:outer membrane protein
MKKIILIALAVFSLNTIKAQTKIAHVNSQNLLDTMPSRKIAIKQLQEFEAAGMKELQEMEADFQKAYQKYAAEQGTLSPVMRQYEEERLQKKQYALQAREQELQTQMQNLSGELNAPILKRVQKAVDIVAERKKFNYVIDESVTLFFKGGTDITSEVLVELLRLDKEETKK